MLILIVYYIILNNVHILYKLHINIYKFTKHTKNILILLSEILYTL